MFELRKVESRMKPNTYWYGIWDDSNCKFLEPQTLGIEEDDIKEYCKNNPFPKNNLYPYKDMVYDITESEGSLILPTNNKKVAEWVCDMLNKLTKQICLF